MAATDGAATTGAPPVSSALTALQRERRVAAIAFLAGAGVWLLTHRYEGIPEDAGLYTMLAMNWAYIGAFTGDLALVHGSQDSFTLFSPLYGTLIRWFGLRHANIGLLLGVYALWLAGAWLLTHRLVRGVPGHIAFFMICALEIGYGGWSNLYAGEIYLTARPLAEALVLLGLAAVFSRSPAGLAGMLLIALALAFHPIMGLAGLGAAFLFLAARRPVLLWAAPLGAGVVMALAMAHIEPFGRLLATIDKDWFAIVGDGFTFTGAWKPEDWAKLFADLAIVGSAAAWARGDRRRILLAVWLTASAGVGLSILGGDILRNTLLSQLQTWRLAWLLAVIKLPAMVLVWLRLRRRPCGRLASVLLAAPLLMLGPRFEQIDWAPALVSSGAGWIVALLARRNHQPGFLVRNAKWLTGAAVVLPLANIGGGLIFTVIDAQFWLQHHTSNTDLAGFQPVRLGWLTAATTLVLIAPRREFAAICAAAILLIASVVFWDTQSPRERYLLGAHASLGASLIPQGAQILWEADAVDTWIILRRPSYVSVTHTGGLIFNRDATLEWARRAAQVAPLAPMSGDVRRCSDLQRPIPVDRVALVCRRAVGLYGVVVDNPVADAQSFTTSVARVSLCSSGSSLGVHSTNRFYYLPCSQFMDKAPGEPSDGQHER
jgi:hypothetical protein